MESLIIAPTKSTPKINFDAQQHVLEITGQSYPEDATKFYQPIFNWLNTYLAATEQTVILKVKLIYINTSSSKCLMTILDMMEDAYHKGIDIRAEWHYDGENEIALESGQDFSDGLDLPFTLIADN